MAGWRDKAEKGGGMRDCNSILDPPIEDFGQIRVNRTYLAEHFSRYM